MDNLSEKAHVGEVGDPEAYRIKSEALSPSVSDFDFTPEEQKKIIRRVDYRLVTTVGAMYVSIYAPLRSSPRCGRVVSPDKPGTTPSPSPPRTLLR